MKQRILSLLTALIMVFSLLPGTALAASLSTALPANITISEIPEISMGNTTVDISGGAATVTVPVIIENNPGFGGMDLNFSIPEGWSIAEIKTDFLTPDNYTVFCNLVSYGSASFPVLFVTPVINANSNGVGRLVAVSALSNITTDGYICWVKYNVPAGLENGDHEVTVSANKINANEDIATDIKNAFIFTPGIITVVGAPVPHEHSYAANRYVWANDYSSCTAFGICECGDTAVAEGVITSRTSPDGENTTIYTAVFSESWTAAQTKTVESLDASPHHASMKTNIWSTLPTATAHTTSSAATAVCGSI